MGEWSILTDSLIPATPSDGRTATKTQYSVIPVPVWDYDDLGVSSSNTSAYFEAWVKKVCATFPGRTHCVFIGTVIPNSRGSVMCEIYDTSTLSGGLPQYCSGVFHRIDGYTGVRIVGFSTLNYSFVFSDNQPKTMFVIETKQSGSVTITANSHTTVNVDISKTGYTPIGIVGVTWSGNSWPVLGGFYMTSSSNAALYVINPTSSAMSITKYFVSVLYIQD